MTNWNPVNGLELECLLLADRAAFVGAVVGTFLSVSRKLEVIGGGGLGLGGFLFGGGCGIGGHECGWVGSGFGVEPGGRTTPPSRVCARSAARLSDLRFP